MRNKKKIKTIVLSGAATLLVAGAAGAADGDPSARDVVRESGVKPIATGAKGLGLVADAMSRDPDKKDAKRKRNSGGAQAIPQPKNGMIEGVSLSTLEAIADCESGGDPHAVNAAGYYGKYQFDTQTWAAVGGSGNPADASEAEQDYRAALLYSQSGSSPWPVCGV